MPAMKRVPDALDSLLKRVPEPETEAPVACREIILLRAGRAPPAVAHDIEARLALDPDGRRFFEHFDAEPDERQMRRAIEVALVGPSALPRSPRWPWALGGGGLALLIVLLLLLMPQSGAMPDYDVTLHPPAEAGLVRIRTGNLTIRATPQAAPSQPIQAQAFVGHSDGLYVSSVPAQVAADGSVTLDAPVETWFPQAGRYAVHVAIMPKNRTLAVVDGRLVDRHLGQAGVRWLSWPVAWRIDQPAPVPL